MAGENGKIPTYAGGREMEEAEYAKYLELVGKYGENDVFTTDTLQDNFEVNGFGGGICVVTRKADNKRGSLDFVHQPRFYFGWEEYKPRR